MAELPTSGNDFDQLPPIDQEYALRQAADVIASQAAQHAEIAEQLAAGQLTGDDAKTAWDILQSSTVHGY